MKDIKGFEGLYAITEKGSVWSYPKEWDRSSGIPCSHGGKWLKPTVVKIGYEMVSLFKGEKVYKKYIHRLVAEAFLPINMTVNHKNGIKIDNRLENLEWATQRENALHARQVLKIGAPKGEKHASAKLNDSMVREMRELREKKKLTHKELGIMFGVDSSVVSRIVNRQYWTHVK